VWGGGLLGPPGQPDQPAGGIAGPVLDMDPAGGLEGGQGIPDGLGAAAQILGQPAVGRPAGIVGPGGFEQGGGEDGPGPVGRPPGVLAQLVGQGGEGKGLALGCRVLARGRTGCRPGPRSGGRRGASGCREVHGSSPRSPASIRAWNAGAESASTAFSA